MKESNQNSRSANMELLRILMMLQIIFLHIVSYGGYLDFAGEATGSRRFVFELLRFTTRCPVYIFIMLMGYFLSGKELRYTDTKRKVIKAYLPMLFYSLVLAIICAPIGIGEEDDYVSSFFPFLSRRWYFMTLYIIVLILAPFLNRMIQGLSRRDFLILLGILFGIFSVIQQLSLIEPFSTVVGTNKIIDTDGGKSLYDFVFMYLLGAFMRHYSFVNEAADGRNRKKSDENLRRGRILRLLAVFILLALVNVYMIYRYPDTETALLYNDNPISVVQGVCLLRAFELLDLSKYPRLSRVICTISGCNIGVYLIHEHPFVREFIWNGVFTDEMGIFYDESQYAGRVLLAVIMIYVTCWLIEKLRQRLFTAVGIK